MLYSEARKVWPNLKSCPSMIPPLKPPVQGILYKMLYSGKALIVHCFSSMMPSRLKEGKHYGHDLHRER